VTIFLGAGYWFGTAQWVQDYLALALVVIVVASALPGLVVWAVHRLRRRDAAPK
jgi:membrane protein DedA with SNARE-associated domain